MKKTLADYEKQVYELFDSLNTNNSLFKIAEQWYEESNRLEKLVMPMLTEISEYLKRNSTEKKQAFIKLYDDLAGSIYLQDRKICSDIIWFAWRVVLLRNKRIWMDRNNCAYNNNRSRRSYFDSYTKMDKCRTLAGFPYNDAANNLPPKLFLKIMIDINPAVKKKTALKTRSN